MKFCQHCGKEVMEAAVICPNCGCAVNNAPAPAAINANDQVSVGLVILSILIPLFGIIYWPVKAKETPKKAKACGVAALISWGVSLFLTIAMSACTASLLYL